MGSRDSDSSLSGDENAPSSSGKTSSTSDKNSKKSDSPSVDDSVNQEPKSNNSCGSSEEGGNTSGSGSSSGYANGVSSSHSSESIGCSKIAVSGQETRSKYPSKKKDSLGYRQYHSEIEKKRRNKINSMIDELAELVPMCRGVSHKLDKLTVLKMTVQHMKMLTQKSAAEGICSPFKPPCISEDEMKYLLEQAGNGFLFVLSSDRAQILYISDAVWEVMHYSPSELIGRSFYDIVHSRDVSVIKDQLTPFASLPSINSARAARVGKPGHSRPEVGCMTGSRRSFFCRFRTLWKQGQYPTDQSSFCLMNKPKSKMGIQYGNDASCYTVVHCTGFLKSWQTADTPVFGVDDDVGLSTFCCFIAVGRRVDVFQAKSTVKVNASETSLIPTQFTSHHTADAKILYVDPRVVSISGFLPQDLVGQSEYDYIHQDDIPALADTFKKVLIKKDQGRVVSNVYRMRAKSGVMIPMRTVAFSLFNPYSKELEYIVHKNCIVQEFSPQICNQPPQQLALKQVQPASPDQAGDNRNTSPRIRIGSKRQLSEPCDTAVVPTTLSSENIPLSMVLPRKDGISRELITLAVDTDLSNEVYNGELDRLDSGPILLSPLTASLVRRGAISIDFAAVSQALAGSDKDGKVLSLTKFYSKGNKRQIVESKVISDYYLSPAVEPRGQSEHRGSQSASSSKISVDPDCSMGGCVKSPLAAEAIHFQGSPLMSKRGNLDAKDYYSQLLQLLPVHEELGLMSCDQSENDCGNSSSGIDSGQNSENGSDNGVPQKPNNLKHSQSAVEQSQMRTVEINGFRQRSRTKPSNSSRMSEHSKQPGRQLSDIGHGNRSSYSSNVSTASGYLSSESGDIMDPGRQNEVMEEILSHGKGLLWKDKDLVGGPFSSSASSGNCSSSWSNGSSDLCDRKQDFNGLSAAALTAMMQESLDEQGRCNSASVPGYCDIAAMLALPRQSEHN